jgi:hypothetical protein
MPKQPTKPEEPNLITKIIAWEREQAANGVKLGPTIEAYVNENAKAIKESSKRLAKMTHAERTAQLHRNSAMPTIHDDVRASLFLVFALPIPESKHHANVWRFEGYFLCRVDNPFPTGLLKELLAKRGLELLKVHQTATGEIGCLREGAMNRTQVIDDGYALVLKKKLCRVSPEQRYIKKSLAKKKRTMIEP